LLQCCFKGTQKCNDRQWRLVGSPCPAYFQKEITPVSIPVLFAGFSSYILTLSKVRFLLYSSLIYQPVLWYCPAREMDHSPKDSVSARRQVVYVGQNYQKHHSPK